MKTVAKQGRTIVAIVCAVLGGAAGAAETVALSLGDRVALQYRQTPNPNKVYVAELYSPAGAQVLLDAPQDHLHHHGLMLAFQAEGVDFWLNGETMGTQRPRGVAALTERSLSQKLDWVAPDGRALLVEERVITLHPVADQAYTLIAWHSRLTPAPGVEQVNLTGHHYHGLGLRLPKTMDGKARFMFLNEGESVAVRGSERVTLAEGVACVGPLAEGRQATVAMFSRDAIHWFTMSCSLTYLSATRNLYRERIVLAAGQTIEFRHGVAVWDGGAVGARELAQARGFWMETWAKP